VSTAIEDRGGNGLTVDAGGKDGTTLCITGAGALWRLPLAVSGMPY
jgi:hypothetical protein